jgi:hypothetical protein
MRLLCDSLRPIYQTSIYIRITFLSHSLTTAIFLIRVLFISSQPPFQSLCSESLLHPSFHTNISRLLLRATNIRSNTCHFPLSAIQIPSLLFYHSYLWFYDTLLLSTCAFNQNPSNFQWPLLLVAIRILHGNFKPLHLYAWSNMTSYAAHNILSPQTSSFPSCH